MTLKELSEHPEMANPKEIDAINDVIQEIKKRVKYLCGLTEGITLDSGREPDDIAESFYQENMILSAILESFVSNACQDFRSITKFVFNNSDHSFIDSLPITEYYGCIAKLCVLSLLEIKEEDEMNPVFAITELGYEALRQQSFSSIAQSALFNMQARKLNEMTMTLTRQSIRLNWLMLIVAIAAAFVSVISFIVSLR